MDKLLHATTLIIRLELQVSKIHTS